MSRPFAAVFAIVLVCGLLHSGGARAAGDHEDAQSAPVSACDKERLVQLQILEQKHPGVTTADEKTQQAGMMEYLESLSRECRNETAHAFQELFGRMLSEEINKELQRKPSGNEEKSSVSNDRVKRAPSVVSGPSDLSIIDDPRPVADDAR